MTEAVQVALITGAVTVTTVALTTWIQSKRIGRVDEKLDQQTVQAAVVEKKVDEVHVVVNNKADLSARKIESLEGQVKSLTEILSKSIRTGNGPGKGGP